MRAKIQDTYNIQVVEHRSHSFAFCFPPEGDFAPEAHHIPASPQKLLHQTQKTKTKKSSRDARLQTSKTAQATEKGAAVNKKHVAGHVHQRRRTSAGCGFVSAHEDVAEVDD